VDVLPAFGMVGAALAAGLLGGVHCAAMCGGIAGAIQVAEPIRVPVYRSRGAFVVAALKRALPFNIGRVLGYALAGGIAGAIGAGWSQSVDNPLLRQSLFAAANLMLILLGVSLVTGWRLSGALERAGGRTWSLFRPIAARLMQSRSSGRGVLLGLLWGAMPCALVYAMLLSALASASPVQGALILFAFGLGTLPNLLGIGLAWAWPAAYGELFSPRSRFNLKFWLGIGIASFGALGFLRMPAVAALSGLGGLGALCHGVLT
jgi:uncharacterized protein